MLRVDARRVRGQRGLRVQHGRQQLVGHVHQLGGFTCRVAVVGGHGGQHVAHAAHFLAFGDQAGPVVDQEAHPALAGYVGRGEHGAHAGQGPCARGVDAQHAGPRVRRQRQRAVQHARHRQVADEGPVAQRGERRIHARQRLADMAVGARRRHGRAALHGGQQLHRVDDLHVAGAAAQVQVQRLGDGLARGGGFTVGDGLGTNRDAGDAEAALQPGGGGKAGGDLFALGRRQAVQRDDGLAVGHLGGHRAGGLGVAVDQGHAATALALRAAAVLQRGDAAAFAQGVQEPLVGTYVHLTGCAVEYEVDLHGVLDARGWLKCVCKLSGAIGGWQGLAGKCCEEHRSSQHCFATR